MVHKCTAQIQLTNRTLSEVQSFERDWYNFFALRKKCLSRSLATLAYWKSFKRVHMTLQQVHPITIV